MRTHKSALSAVVVASLMILWAAPAAAQLASGASGKDSILRGDIDRMEFMVTLHSRAAFVPDGLLDAFYDEHASLWSEGQTNASIGAAFSWRKRGELELSVLVDWVDLSTPDAFWKEAGKPATDADWTQINLQVLSLVFASYWNWAPTPWLTPYVGGGIGVGVLLGDIVRYDPVDNGACEQGLGQDPNQFAPDVCFGADGGADPGQVELGRPESGLPIPVIPVVHAAGGVRFNIAEHAVLRLELGVNNYLYAGASIGAQWW